MKKKEILRKISKDPVLLGLFNDALADIGREWKAWRDYWSGKDIRVHKSKYHY